MSCETFWGTKHNFDKWEVTEIGYIQRHGKNIGKYLYQQRRCKDCGYVETDINSNENL